MAASTRTFDLKFAQIRKKNNEKFTGLVPFKRVEADLTERVLPTMNSRFLILLK